MDKKKAIIVAAILAALAIIAVLVLAWSRGNQPGETNLAPPIPAKTKRVFAFNIFSVDMKMKVGEARITEEEEKTKVTLEFNEEIPRGVKPSHIHAGTCENPGWSKYVINYPSDGKSETMFEISLDEFMGELPLIVDLHESTDKMKKMIACGEIKMPGNGENTQ